MISLPKLPAERHPAKRYSDTGKKIFPESYSDLRKKYGKKMRQPASGCLIYFQLLFPAQVHALQMGLGAAFPLAIMDSLIFFMISSLT